MVYRTYKAPTYKEAVVNAKMDLGSDVYIIGRKDIKEGGFLGMFKKQYTEITVAKNEDISKALSRKIKNRQTSEQGEEKPEQQNSTPQGGIPQGGIPQGGRPQGGIPQGGIPQGGIPQGGIPQGDGPRGDGSMYIPSTHERDTKGELSGGFKEGDLNSVNIISELERIKKQLDKIMINKGGEDNPSLSRLIQLLKENDFTDDYIDGIRSTFEKELTLKDISTPEIFSERVKNYILTSIDVSGPIEIGSSKPEIVVLVGPTGVGKTTTIAKLAASFGVLQKKKLELITIDFYRIAAIEQLGKYAELMQLPFTPVNTREEFKSAVKNSSAELIFVDTVGRSQRNNMGLAELRNILDGIKAPMDIHLVLSATTKYRDTIDVVTRFNQLLYNKIIISKLDETNTVGSLLSALQDKKISYLTTGQSVPDDIEIASKEKLYEMIALDGLGDGPAG